MKEYFDNLDELMACFKKWQPRLGLSDWNIGLALLPRVEMDDENVAGWSEVQWVNRCGLIEILRKEDMPKDLLIKQVHECTLIHEMLHFKFFSLGIDKGNSVEETFYDMSQHQLLEELARALFMAEYNLTPEWFYITRKEEN